VPDPIPPFQKSIIPCNSTIIVGVSGGPDSIYLLYQLKAVAEHLNLKLIAAHLDHEWQESSKIAANLCQQTCDSLQVPVVIKTIAELKFCPKWNGSQEELGRIMRRHFFTALAQEHQASAIALAHHQQDQQETFFIRLLRGSGLTGLTGIKEVDGLYIRPMLACTKSEILEYLHTNNIAYYIDQTNTSDVYLRNRIRNQVIPALQKVDDRFDQKLQSTMLHLAQVDDFLEQQAEQILKSQSTDHGINIENFLSLHQVLQQRILLKMMIAQQVTFTPSQNLFKEIMRFLEQSSSNKHTIHDSWMVKKTKQCFAIEKIKNQKKSDKTL
jgi:tRNA(Ile)-lysidine synthase